jgi:uncharacterized membrane protein YdbT with pleckstrin-like domain
MQPWFKKGMINGLKGTLTVGLIGSIWALIIMISESLGINPGWSMIVFIVIGIFAMSLDMAHQKYKLEDKEKV